ncbi:hypothetical protein GVX86_00230 [[Haemophilus] felis]|nr:hypothetical protein [[Haemophilus] felis]
MNKIFRVIFSKTLGRLIVTSELAKGECKAKSNGENGSAVKEAAQKKGGKYQLNPMAFVVAAALSMPQLAFAGLDRVVIDSATGGAGYGYHYDVNKPGYGKESVVLAQTEGSSRGLFGSEELNKRASMWNLQSENSVIIGANGAYAFNEKGDRNGNKKAEGAVAIGSGVRVFGSQGTAVGQSATAGAQATAVGADAIAAGISSIAIGSDDTSAYEDKLPVDTIKMIFGFVDENNPSVEPNVNKTDFAGVVTWGRFKENYINSSQAGVGDKQQKYSPTYAKGISSIAIGSRAIAEGTASLSIGTLSVARAEKATAVGIRTYVDKSAVGATAIGESTRVYASNSLAIGNRAEATSQGALAFGAGSKAVGKGSIAIGEQVYTNTSLTQDSSDNFMNRLRNAAKMPVLTIATEASGAFIVNANETTKNYNERGKLSVNANENYFVKSGFAANQNQDQLKSLITSFINGDSSLNDDLKNKSGFTGSNNAKNVANAPDFDFNEVGNTILRIGNEEIKKTKEKGEFGTSLGYYINNTGTASTAIGTTSAVEGSYSVSLGALNYIAPRAFNTVALGVGVNVQKENSIAIGSGSNMLGAGAVAIGPGTVVARDNAVAVGYGSTVLSPSGIGVGTGSNIGKNSTKSIAIGNNAFIKEGLDDSITYEYRRNNATPNGSYTKQQVGTNGILHNGNSTVILTVKEAKAGGEASAIAIGPDAKIEARRGIAIGVGSHVNLANSIALGVLSKTDYTENDFAKAAYSPRGSYTIPTNSRVGVFSVGSKGNERRIINVASGALDSDAVNVAQLKSLEDRLEYRVDSSDKGVHYYAINQQSTDLADFVKLAKREGDYRNYVTYMAQKLMVMARKTNGENINEAGLADLYREVKKLHDDATVSGKATHITNLINEVYNNKVDIYGESSGAQRGIFDKKTNTKYFDSNNIKLSDFLDALDKAKSADLADEAIAKLYTDDERERISKSNYLNNLALGKDSIAIGYKAQTSDIAWAETDETISKPGEPTVTIKKYTPRAGTTDDTSGLNALAVGTYAKATGKNSSAIGRSAEATKQGALSFGYEAKVQSTDSLAIGVGAEVKTQADKSVAIGKGALVGVGNKDNSNSVAVGFSSQALGLATVAVGKGATANSKNSIAIGTDATATESDAIAIGNKLNVYGNNSILLGSAGSQIGNKSSDSSKNRTAEWVTAIGQEVKVFSETKKVTNTVAIGSHLTVDQSNAVVIGKKAKVSSEYGVAIGSGENSSGKAYAPEVSVAGGIALGSYSNSNRVINHTNSSGYDPATGVQITETTYNGFGSGNGSATKKATWRATEGALAIGNGDGSKTRQITGVAAGTKDYDAVNVAQLKKVPVTRYFSVSSTSTGTGSNYANDGAGGSNSIAIGYEAKVPSANNAIALGYGAKVNHNSSIAIGHSAKVEGDDARDAVAIGESAQVTKVNAIAIGNGSRAEGKEALALGKDAKALGNGTIAIGHQVASKGNDVTTGAQTNRYTAQATEWGVLIGNSVSAYGNRNTKITDVVVVGGNSQSKASHTVAIGNAAKTLAAKAVAIGKDAEASAVNGIAIGENTKATQANSVALGSNSETGAAQSTTNLTTNLYGDQVVINFNGGTGNVNGTVSVGKANYYRTISNVAAGDVSSSSTDAINGSQLYALAITPIKFAGDSGTTVNRILGQQIYIKGKADSGITVTGYEANKTLEIDIQGKGGLTAGDGIALDGNKTNRLVGTGDVTVKLSDDYKNKINSIKTYTVEADGNDAGITVTPEDVTGGNTKKFKVKLDDSFKNKINSIDNKADNSVLDAYAKKDASNITGSETAWRAKLDVYSKSETYSKTDVDRKGITFKDSAGGSKLVTLGKSFKLEGGDDITATVAADGTDGGKVTFALSKETSITDGTQSTKTVTAKAVADYVATKAGAATFKYKSTNPNTGGATGTTSSSDQSFNLKGTEVFTFEGDRNITTTATSNNVKFTLKDDVVVNSIGGPLAATTGQGSKITFNQDALTVNNKKISGVAKGIANTDAVNKQQLDEGLAKKENVLTKGNLTTGAGLKIASGSGTSAVIGQGVQLDLADGLKGKIDNAAQTTNFNALNGGTEIEVTGGGKVLGGATSLSLKAGSVAKVKLATDVTDILDKVGTGAIANNDNKTVTGGVVKTAIEGATTEVKNYVDSKTFTFSAGTGGDKSLALGKKLTIGESTGDITTMIADDNGNAKVTFTLEKETTISETNKNSTKVATTKAVKDYVDTQLGAQAGHFEFIVEDNVTPNAGSITVNQSSETNKKFAITGHNNIETKVSGRNLEVHLSKNVDLTESGSLKLGTGFELKGANKTATIGGISVNGGATASIGGLKALEGTGTTKGTISFTDGSKDIGFNTGKLTNIAEGAISSSSTDAISGKQLSGLATTVLGLSDPNATAFTAPSFTAVTGGSNTAKTTFKGVIDDLITAANKGLKFQGNDSQDVTRNLGETLKIVGEGTIAGTAPNTAANNIKVTKKTGQTDTLEIGLAKDLVGITSVANGNGSKVELKDAQGITFTAGAQNPVTLKDGAFTGVASVGKDGNNGLSFNATGNNPTATVKVGGNTLTVEKDTANNSNKVKLTGLADPTQNDGAATKNYVDAQIAGNNSIKYKATNATAPNQTIGTQQTVSLANGFDFRSTENITTSVDANGVVQHSLDAVLNNMQSISGANGNKLDLGANGTVSPITLTVGAGNGQAGASVTLAQDGTDKVKATGLKTIGADDNNAIVFNNTGTGTNNETASLKVGGSALTFTRADETSGTATTPKVKISNLANGTVSDSSTDAINGSQLHSALESIKTALGGNSTNTNGAIGSVSFNLPKAAEVNGVTGNNNTAKTTINDALTTLDTAIGNLKANATDAEIKYTKNSDTNKKSVKLSEGFNFSNGTNTTAEVDESGVVKFNLNSTLTGITEVNKATGKGALKLTDNTATLESANNNSKLSLADNTAELTSANGGSIKLDGTDTKKNILLTPETGAAATIAKDGTKNTVKVTGVSSVGLANATANDKSKDGSIDFAAGSVTINAGDNGLGTTTPVKISNGVLSGLKVLGTDGNHNISFTQSVTGQNGAASKPTVIIKAGSTGVTFTKEADGLTLHGLAKGAIEATTTTGNTGTFAVTTAQLADLSSKLGTTVDTNKTGFNAVSFTAVKGSTAAGTTPTAQTTFKGAIDNLITAVNKGLTFKGNDGTTNSVTRELGQTLNIVGEVDPATTTLTTAKNNIQVTKKGQSDDTLVIGLSKYLTGIESITKGTGKAKIELGDSSITLTPATGKTVSIDNTGKLTATGGLDAGSQKVTKVADGTISDSSTDAITGKQLHASLEKIKDIIGGGATNIDGTISAPTFTLTNSKSGANKNSTTVGDAITTLDTAIGELKQNATDAKIKYTANSATTKKEVKLSDGLNFTNGTNTTATVDTDGVVKFSLEDTVSLTNSGSLTIAKDTNVATSKDIKLDKDGLVGTPKVGLDDTANLGFTSNTVNIKAGTGTATFNNGTLYGLTALGESGTHNLSFTKKDTAQNTGEDTAIIKAGSTGATFTKTTDGLTLHGLAKGTIEAVNGKTGTYAVTTAQLHDLSTHLGTTVNGDKTGFTAPTFTAIQGGSQAATGGVTGLVAPTTFKAAIDDLITAVNKGFEYKADVKSDNTVATDYTKQVLGSKIDIVKADTAGITSSMGTYSGSNLITKYTNTAGNGKFEIALKEKPEFKEVKLADTAHADTTMTLNPTGSTILTKDTSDPNVTDKYIKVETNKDGFKIANGASADGTVVADPAKVATYGLDGVTVQNTNNTTKVTPTEISIEDTTPKTTGGVASKEKLTINKNTIDFKDATGTTTVKVDGTDKKATIGNIVVDGKTDNSITGVTTVGKGTGNKAAKITFTDGTEATTGNPTTAATDPTISVNNARLTNVAAPTDDTDAANKKYVDDKLTASDNRVDDVDANRPFIYKLEDKEVVRGQDGKLYKKEDLTGATYDKASGKYKKPKAGGTTEDVTALADTEVAKVTIEARSNDANKPLVIGNIASALGLDNVQTNNIGGSTAITADKAKTAMASLLSASGASLTKAVTLADLQAVAQAGLDFSGNFGTVHRTLGSRISIVGNETISPASTNTPAVALKDFTEKNVVTEAKDNKVIIKLAKRPEFTGIEVKGEDSSDKSLTEITPNGLTVANKEGEETVSLKGATEDEGASLTLTDNEGNERLSFEAADDDGATAITVKDKNNENNVVIKGAIDNDVASVEVFDKDGNVSTSTAASSKLTDAIGNTNTSTATNTKIITKNALSANAGTAPYDHTLTKVDKEGLTVVGNVDASGQTENKAQEATSANYGLNSATITNKDKSVEVAPDKIRIADSTRYTNDAGTSVASKSEIGISKDAIEFKDKTGTTTVKIDATNGKASGITTVGKDDNNGITFTPATTGNTTTAAVTTLKVDGADLTFTKASETFTPTNGTATNLVNIGNVATPTTDYHAVNKKFVDEQLAGADNKLNDVDANRPFVFKLDNEEVVRGQDGKLYKKKDLEGAVYDKTTNTYKKKNGGIADITVNALNSTEVEKVGIFARGADGKTNALALGNIASYLMGNSFNPSIKINKTEADQAVAKLLGIDVTQNSKDLLRAATIADLQAVALAGLNFTANSGDVHRKLGEKLYIVGNESINKSIGNGTTAPLEAEMAKYDAKNIVTEAKNDKIIIKMAKRPEFEGIDVKNADGTITTIDPGKIAIADKDGNESVSLAGADDTEGATLTLGDKNGNDRVTLEAGDDTTPATLTLKDNNDKDSAVLTAANGKDGAVLELANKDGDKAITINGGDEAPSIELEDKAGNKNTATAANNTFEDTNKNTNVVDATGSLITKKDDNGGLQNSASYGVNGVDLVDHQDGSSTRLNTERLAIADGDNNSTVVTATTTNQQDKDGNTNVSTATSETLTDTDGNTNVSTATSNTLKDTENNQTEITAEGVKVQDAEGNTVEVNAEEISLSDTDGYENTTTASGTNIVKRDPNSNLVKESADFNIDGVTLSNDKKGSVKLESDKLSFVDKNLKESVVIDASNHTIAIKGDNGADGLTLNGKEGTLTGLKDLDDNSDGTSAANKNYVDDKLADAKAGQPFEYYTVEGGKDVKVVRGRDGKLYKEEDLNKYTWDSKQNKYVRKDGTTTAPAEPTEIPSRDVIVKVMPKEKPVAVGNVASGIGMPYISERGIQGMTSELGKARLANEALYGLKGNALNNVATVGDLQAVAFSGLSFKGNDTSATKEVHRKLGETLVIKGEEETAATAPAGTTAATPKAPFESAAGNIYVDVNDKALIVKLAKAIKHLDSLESDPVKEGEVGSSFKLSKDYGLELVEKKAALFSEDVITTTNNVAASGSFVVEKDKDGNDKFSTHYGANGLTTTDHETDLETSVKPGAIDVSDDDDNSVSITPTEIAVEDADGNSNLIDNTGSLIVSKNADGTVKDTASYGIDGVRLTNEDGSRVSLNTEHLRLEDENGATNIATATTSELADAEGNTNTSTATSNTLKDDEGNETRTTAEGLSVNDSDGNSVDITSEDVVITDNDGHEATVSASGTSIVRRDTNTNTEKESADFRIDGVTLNNEKGSAKLEANKLAFVDKNLKEAVTVDAEKRTISFAKDDATTATDGRNGTGSITGLKDLDDNSDGTSAANKNYVDDKLADAKAGQPFEYYTNDNNAEKVVRGRDDKLYKEEELDKFKWDAKANKYVAKDTAANPAPTLTALDSNNVVVKAMPNAKPMVIGNVASGIGPVDGALTGRRDAVISKFDADKVVGKLEGIDKAADLNKVATVGDLQAVAVAGLNVAGNDNNKVSRKIGETLKITGEGNLTGATAANNIRVDQNAGKDGVEIKLAANLKDIDSIESKAAENGKSSFKLSATDGLEVVSKDDEGATTITKVEASGTTVETKDKDGNSTALATYDANAARLADPDGNEASLTKNGLEVSDEDENSTTVNADGITITDKDDNEASLTSKELKLSNENGDATASLKGADGTNGASLELTNAKGDKAISINAGDGTNGASVDLGGNGKLTGLADLEDGADGTSATNKNYVDEKLAALGSNKPFEYRTQNGESVVRGQDGLLYKENAIKDKVFVDSVGYVEKAKTEKDPKTGKYSLTTAEKANEAALKAASVASRVANNDAILSTQPVKGGAIALNNIGAATESVATFSPDPEFRTVEIDGVHYDRRDVAVEYSVKAGKEGESLVKVGGKFFNRSDLEITDEGTVKAKDGATAVEKTAMVDGKVYARENLNVKGMKLDNAEALVKVGDGANAKYYRATDVVNGQPKSGVFAVNDVNNKEHKVFDELADLKGANANSALTVDDARRLGFVVATRTEDPQSDEAKNNNYSAKVQHANKLEVVGGNNIEVIGVTKGNTREIKVSMVKDPNFESIQLSHTLKDEQGNKVGKLDGAKLSTGLDGDLYLSKVARDEHGNLLTDATGKPILAPVAINGVADGLIAPNSKQAVNGGQLYDVKRDLQQTDRRLSAGIAGALAVAGLTQNYSPGGRSISVAGGSYNGQNAVAFGVSATSDNGRFVIKAAATQDSSGKFGGNVGFGYHW